MNTRNLSILSPILFLALLSTSVFAQFEGQITMNVFNKEKGQVEVSELNLYATADRIMVKGEENFDIMDNMSTDGVLIRNDVKDFVIMTGNNQALQVTKIEIEGLVEMISSWNGDSKKNSSGSSNANYEFSDRTKTMLGFETAELVIRDNKNPNKHLSVWLTPGIDINWGMLAEKWNNMPPNLDQEINGISQDIIFKSKNYPLLIEAVEGEKRTTIMEVTNVNRSSVAKAMVEVPSGVALVSFKDYVFKMMMEQ